jgi:L-lactate dehydrogenase complex protein LldG
MSRDAILSAVRAACATTRADTGRDAALTARLATPPQRHPSAQGEETAGLVQRFGARIAAQGADIVTVARSQEIPSALVTYLRAHAVPLALRAGNDPYLSALPWDGVPELARGAGAAQPEDMAGLSVAVAGVAETGTLVLASSADNPTTLAFLPETHLVVVRAETVVATYEEACRRFAGPLPRTLNFVSGPSRTGDIGGKLVLGAHGPRRLAVFVVAN